jgi:hypothetical protein
MLALPLARFFFFPRPDTHRLLPFRPSREVHHGIMPSLGGIPSFRDSSSPYFKQSAKNRGAYETQNDPFELCVYWASYMCYNTTQGMVKWNSCSRFEAFSLFKIQLCLFLFCRNRIAIVMCTLHCEQQTCLTNFFFSTEPVA